MSALREVSNLPSSRVVDPKQRHASYVAGNTVATTSSLAPTQHAAAALSFSSQPSLTASESNIENVYTTTTTMTANVHVDVYGKDRGGVGGSSDSGASTTMACAAQHQHQQQQPRASALVARRTSSRSCNSRHSNDPTYCSDLIHDIMYMYNETERLAVSSFNAGMASHDSNTSSVHRYFPSAHYLRYQPEINEKMRVILIDWLIDVHIKFKLHPETMYLAVNLFDRYMSCVNLKFNNNTYIPRAKLQLVGMCAMMVAAKYEEIWPPHVNEFVLISANTYTRDEVLQMERHMCTTLRFRLTVPTAYPFAMRLLTVLDDDDILGRDGVVRRSSSGGTRGSVSRSRSRDGGGGSSSADAHPVTSPPRSAEHELLRHATGFFMEHALLNYNCLQYTPSQVGCASVYLALLTTRLKFGAPTTLSTRVWPSTLESNYQLGVSDLRECAQTILEFVSYVPTTKYQAVRRKYNSVRNGEVTKCAMPSVLPTS